jgi:hypothetical protein
MAEKRHSGARNLPASPESKNTGLAEMSMGLCASIPRPTLTGRLGMTINLRLR